MMGQIVAAEGLNYAVNMYVTLSHVAFHVGE